MVNADCIIIMGSNMAEAHPVGFQWVMEAKARGAQACPTKSIQFGPLDELRERAAHRLDELREAGVPEARLYGHDPADGVGGDGAFFLLLDEPEVYGLPPDPVVPTRNLASTWKYTSVAAAGLLAAAAAAFIGRRPT